MALVFSSQWSTIFGVSIMVVRTVKSDHIVAKLSLVMEIITQQQHSGLAVNVLRVEMPIISFTN